MIMLHIFEALPPKKTCIHHFPFTICYAMPKFMFRGPLGPALIQAETDYDSTLARTSPFALDSLASPITGGMPGSQTWRRSDGYALLGSSYERRMKTETHCGWLQDSFFVATSPCSSCFRADGTGAIDEVERAKMDVRDLKSHGVTR